MDTRLKNTVCSNILGVIIISILMAACSKPMQENTTRVISTQEPGVPGKEENVVINTRKPGVPGEEENVVITFAGDEWQRGTYEPLMEEFHRQYPNITVQFAPYPEATPDPQTEQVNFDRRLATTGDTGITWIYGSQNANQYLLNLQPLMEGEPGFNAEDFWDGSLDACQDAEGRPLGLPTTIQVTGIFYDEEAFAEAGYPEPEPGWTWDDFRGAITAVSRPGSRYGYAELGYNTILLPRIDGLIALDGGEIDVKKLQANIQWYLDLVDQGGIYPPSFVEDESGWDKEWEDWQEMFTTPERPAMWIGQLADLFPGSEWINDEENPFANSAINTDGFAPIPVSADNPDEKTSLAFTQCLAISKGSRNPKAAWTWINFLSQQWTGKGQAQAWNLMQIPAKKSTAEANSYWDLIPEKAVPALKFALDHAWYQPGAFGLESSLVLNAMVQDAAGMGKFSDVLELAKAQVQVMTKSTPDNQPVIVATAKPTRSPDTEVVNYFANVDGEEKNKLMKLLERYNEDHPEQVIELTTMLDIQNDWFPTLVDEFDCFYWYRLDPASDQADRLLPLDAFLEEEGADFVNDYNQELFKNFRVNSRLYGLPIASDFQMMAYNKTLLAEKGITLPTNDWTMEDFAKMLELAGGGEGDERTYGYQLDTWDESLFYSRVVRWIDLKANPPIPMLNGPEMTSYVEWIVELKKSGGIYIQTPDNYIEADQILRSGRLAFFRTNASQPRGWAFAFEDPAFDIGVAPFPFIDSHSGGFFVAFERAHMISRNSQHAQACWDWFTFLSEQPAFQLGVPARRSMLESPAWVAAVGEEVANAMRAGQDNLATQAESTAYDPISYPLESFRREAVRRALSGEDIKTVLNEAQQKSIVYLDCMDGIVFDQTNEATISQYMESLRACALKADPGGSEWK